MTGRIRYFLITSDPEGQYYQVELMFHPDYQKSYEQRYITAKSDKSFEEAEEKVLRKYHNTPSDKIIEL
jgi:hypothetical protein